MRIHSVSAASSGNLSSRRVRSLAELFALKCAQDKGFPFRPLSRKAEDLLAAHDWKSDLSALVTTIRRAAIMAEGNEIGADVIRLPTTQSNSDETSESDGGYEAATQSLLGHSVADVERELILLTLECCLGNRTQAADVLDISVRTLRNKLKEYSLNGISIPLPGSIRKKNADHAGKSRNNEDTAIRDRALMRHLRPL